MRLGQAVDLPAGHERLPRVLRVESDVRLDRAAQLPADVAGGADRGPLRGQHRVGGADDDVDEQLLLGPEVLVDTRPADADPGTDLVHRRRPVAVRGEQFQRRGRTCCRVPRADAVAPGIVTSGRIESREAAV